MSCPINTLPSKDASVRLETVDYKTKLYTWRNVLPVGAWSERHNQIESSHLKNSSLISGPHDRLTSQRHNGQSSPWNTVALLWNARTVPGGHSPFSKQSLPGNKRSVCVLCQQCVRGLKAERWCGEIAFAFSSQRGKLYYYYQEPLTQLQYFIETKCGKATVRRYLCDHNHRKLPFLRSSDSLVTGAGTTKPCPQKLNFTEK